MRQAKWVIAVLVAALSGCAPGAVGTPEQGPVLVRTPGGQPIAGATVRFASQTGTSVAAITDADGRVELPGGPPIVATTADAPGRLAVTKPRGGGEFVLADDPNPSDVDGDGSSDGEESTVGTDPANADTDRDGIGDRAETAVVDGFSPVAWGASPLHRDMFVEVDWWDQLGEVGQPTALAMDTLRTAFLDSPLTNPDGTYGIVVHVDAGEYGGGSAVSLPPIPAGIECSVTNLKALRLADNVAPERRDIFFHAFVGPLREFCGYSGVAYAGRSVIINDDGDLSTLLGDVSGGGVYAHEFGHTLGLYHGGNEEVNCKPNYPSIMSYHYLPMVLSGRVGFSLGQQPAVDEAAIREWEPFLIYPNYDLNQNGRIDTVPVAADLTDGRWVDPILAGLFNSVTGFVPELRCPSDGSADSVLTDHDDWATIDRNLPRAVGVPLAEGYWNPEGSAFELARD